MHLVLFILTGLLAGWLAGVLIKGRGFGFAANLFIGLIGALLAWIVFPILGITAIHVIGQILLATAGAILFLLLAVFFAPRRRQGRPIL